MVKELAKVRLQFTSANLERNDSVPESPASIKSFITPKIKIGCKKYLQFTAEAPNDTETEENFSIYPLDFKMFAKRAHSPGYCQAAGHTFHFGWSKPGADPEISERVGWKANSRKGGPEFDFSVWLSVIFL